MRWHCEDHDGAEWDGPSEAGYPHPPCACLVDDAVRILEQGWAFHTIKGPRIVAGMAQGRVSVRSAMNLEVGPRVLAAVKAPGPGYEGWWVR